MLQLLSNMFFSRDKEESPVEILHKARSQRKKKQLNEKLPKKENLHTTESIISNKVKKYLYKLFGGSGFKAFLEPSINSSRSSSVYQPRKEPKVPEFTEDLEESHKPTNKVSFPEETVPFPKYQTNKKTDKPYRPKNLSYSFRKSLIQRKLKKDDIESLNNLYNSNSVISSSNASELKNRKKIKFLESNLEASVSSDLTKTVLKHVKSNSFGEAIDQLIKKQKKKKPSRSTKSSTKKLKKTTKSSISTMCERAKLLLKSSFVEDPKTTDPSTPEIELSEDKEEILTILDLNNYDTLKSSEESIKIFKNKSLESVDFYSKCSPKYNCMGKISSCMNLHHTSKLDRPFFFHDYETNLEIWTTDYINGLVAVNDPKYEEQPVISKIPVKKKCKSVKTKSKKCVKNDCKSVKDDVRLLTGFGQNSHLLGGVKTMEGHQKYSCRPDEAQRYETQRYETQRYEAQKNKEPQRYSQKNNEILKVKDRLPRKGDTCQKVQDIQNYIDNLMFPGDTTRHQKSQKYFKEVDEPVLPKSEQRPSPIYPEKQSLQELKKFQRELKQRIKELEKKMPSTSSAMAKHKITNCASDHELSFLNMSNFLDEDDGNQPKLVNNVRYCTKKNKFNIKMKFGDQFCECCFLGAKKYLKDICRRCNKKVYLVERICAGDGVYHNFCYSCYCCKRSLNSLNLCVTRGEIFCKQCFKKFFGPDIYGFVK